MANNDSPLIHFSPLNVFNHEIQGGYNPISDHQQLESILGVKEDGLIFLDMDGLDEDQQYGFHQQGNYKAEQDQQQQSLIFDDYFDANSIFYPTQLFPFQDCNTSSSTNTLEHLLYGNQIPSSIVSQSPFASLELLNLHRTGFNKSINIDKNATPAETSSQLGHKLSTEEIMRVAGSRYIQFSNQSKNNPNYHPFGFALPGLTDEETKGVELIHLLLSAAEMLGFQRFDHAKTLLRSFKTFVSPKASPIERVASVFAQALGERIEKETGVRVIMTKNHDHEHDQDQDQEIAQGLSTNLDTLKYHQQVPFLQVMQFPAIQAIAKTFESGTRLHLMDLEIRNGIQWTGLMQSLAARKDKPVGLFKITAIGRATTKVKIEETRRRLASLAESLSLPFSFKDVIVSDAGDIGEEMFEIDRENGEIVVFHSSMLLRTMISRPHCLESLMRVIRNLKPSLMTVAEVEADLNSPSFAKRFIEALFFYGMFFDCLEACLNRCHDEYNKNNRGFRTTMEEILAVGIRNIVAEEGIERVNRSVRISVWRAFFARFGMVEVKMSESCYIQASLVAKQFGCGDNNKNSCVISRDGNCIIVGWKGTPMHSLSAWKFL